MKKLLIVLTMFSFVIFNGCVMMSETQIKQSADSMKISDGINKKEAVILAQKYILDHQGIKNEIFSLKPTKIRIVKDEEHSSATNKEFIWKLTFYAKNRRVVSTPLPLDRYHVSIEAETGSILVAEFQEIR